jgi:hypothetical protein
MGRRWSSQGNSLSMLLASAIEQPRTVWRQKDNPGAKMLRFTQDSGGEFSERSSHILYGIRYFLWHFIKSQFKLVPRFHANERPFAEEYGISRWDMGGNRELIQQSIN